MNKAKKYFIVLIGLQMLFAHAGVAYAINSNDPTQGVTQYSGVEAQIKEYLCTPTDQSKTPDQSGSSSITSGSGSVQLNYESGARNEAKYDLYNCINRMYRFAIVLAAAIGVLFIVIAGYLYMSAEGNNESIQKAKDILISTITSFVILFMGYIFLKAINPELIQFKNIQPPSVKVQTADKPVNVVLDNSGNVTSVTGGAGHKASELFWPNEGNRGCKFAGPTQEKEIANISENMFKILKDICYNVAIKNNVDNPLVTSVVGYGKHTEGSYHYKGCAIDFADGSNNYFNIVTKEGSKVGRAVYAAAKAAGIDESRINPGTDRNQTYHIHIDLGTSCPTK